MTAPINICAKLPSGVEVADMVGVDWHIVGINGHAVLVAQTAEGAEIRLPLTDEGATALVVATAGGRL